MEPLLHRTVGFTRIEARAALHNGTRLTFHQMGGHQLVRTRTAVNACMEVHLHFVQRKMSPDPPPLITLMGSARPLAG